MSIARRPSRKHSAGRALTPPRHQKPACGEPSDEAHVRFALTEGRVIFTQDEDFLAIHAAGIDHPGIAYCHQAARNLGEIVRGLILIWEIYAPEEMAGRVEFL